MTPAILFLHIAGGSLAIVAGYAALFAPKGGLLHRRAGMLFVCAMIAMGAGAMIIGLMRGKPTWMGGPFVFYLVVTAMLTVRRGPATSRRGDIALTMLAAIMAAVSVDFSIGVLSGPRAPTVPGQVPPVFPAVASLLNAFVLALCIAGDVRILRTGPLAGTKRLARHLWRMCFAMYTATASFFLGQVNSIPEPLRVGPVLSVFAFLPLLAMFYWLWRVRRRPIGGARRVPITTAPQAVT